MSVWLAALVFVTACGSSGASEIKGAAGAFSTPPANGGSSGAPVNNSGGASSGASAADTAGGSVVGAGASGADSGAPNVAGSAGSMIGGAPGGGSEVAGAGALGGSGPTGKLAAKPAMGWESWWSGHTGTATEADFKATADVMASQLAKSGYEYLLIDDGWHDGFDANGRWKADTRKFPNGIKALADYVHSKGLKLGIYLLPGVNDTVVAANSPIEGTTYHAKDIVTSAAGNTYTVAGYTARALDFSKPGAVEYVQSYANLFASWGIDHVKFDFVGPGGGNGKSDNQEEVKQWRAALDKTGRQIWLNLSNKLHISAIATWQNYSNDWRVENDVECYCSTDTNWAHVIREIKGLPPFASYAGPGHWNDLDSLMIANGDFDGITSDERQTMFSFWSLACSPMIIGADLTKLDAADLAILTNDEVIAINQAAIPPKAVSSAGDQQVWYSKQSDGSFAVGLFNFGAASAQVSVKFSDLGAGSTMNARDLVSHADLGPSSASFAATIPSHGSRLVRLTP